MTYYAQPDRDFRRDACHDASQRQGADLVVWWEEGFYPEEDAAAREIIADFGQETGKDVELVLYPQAELTGKVQATIETGQPPDVLFGLLVDPNIDPWAYDDQLVDLAEATIVPPSE
jgi:ABC-type glycerol-3-phosphate transport system substrate-binding protein